MIVDVIPEPVRNLKDYCKIHRAETAHMSFISQNTKAGFKHRRIIDLFHAASRTKAFSGEL